MRAGIGRPEPLLEALDAHPCRGKDWFFDRHADHAPPFRPRAVVVADSLEAEQLVEREPRVAAPLADAAVGDDILVWRDALRLVQRTQLVGALERSVFSHGLSPRHRHGTGNVAGPL